jgi:hypothetical protein
MAVIGWAPRFFQDISQENHVDLCNLAGNAYSGFAVTPLLMCTFALYSKFASRADTRAISPLEQPISVTDSLELASSAAASAVDSFEDSCDL